MHNVSTMPTLSLVIVAHTCNERRCRRRGGGWLEMRRPKGVVEANTEGYKLGGDAGSCS